MKKYLLILLCLTSCRSLTYNDINPTINPNQNLLPALETSFDYSNLESVYSAGGIYGQANNFGTAYNNNLSSWGQTTTFNARQIKDIRITDALNIFNKEVTENITSPYGKKLGTISLRFGYRGTDTSVIYPLSSYFTFGLLNFLGYPCDKVTDSLEVEVTITNNQKELIGRYTENVQSTAYIAMWWGYDGNRIYRKLAAANMKQAMEKIRIRINNDAPRLKKQLK